MNNIKKLIAMLFSAMAVMLMSTSVFAEVTGEGTRFSPFIVTTYSELQQMVEENDDMTTYIRLGNDITNTQNSGRESSGGESYVHYNYITKDRENTIYIDLDGYTLTQRANCANEGSMFRIIGGKLIMEDSSGGGKIVDNATFYSGGHDMFYVIKTASYDTALIINSGTYTSETGNRIIYHQNNDSYNADVLINGGFISSDGEMAIYSMRPTHFKIREGTVTGRISVVNGYIKNIVNEGSVVYVDKKQVEIISTARSLEGNITIADPEKLRVLQQPADNSSEYVQPTFTFTVKATNAKNFKWYVVDEDKQYTPDELEKYHFGSASEDNTDTFTLYGLTPLINGKKVYCELSNDNETVCTRYADVKVGYTVYNTDFTMENLQYLRAGEKTGNFKDVKVPDNVFYKAADIAWMKHGEDGFCADSDTFNAGATYRLMIYVEPAYPGYNTAATLDGTINDMSAFSGYDSLTDHSYIFKDITIPEDQTGTRIISVYLTRSVKVPVIGAAPSMDFNSLDTRTQRTVNQMYSVSEWSWTPNDSTFETDKSYTVTAKLTASDNYFFSPFEPLTINGDPVEIISASYNDGGSIVFSYTFTAKGDVDLNGVVNKADAAYVLKYLSGTSTISDKQFEAADVYEDSNVDMLDVIAILNKTAV